MKIEIVRRGLARQEPRPPIILKGNTLSPDKLLFAPTHEWVSLATEGGQKVATVGISAFAVEQLTDLVYLELPKVGRTVAAGDSMGEIESVKAVSLIYASHTPLLGFAMESG